MATVEIEVDVFCSCGELLGSTQMRSSDIEVEPCSKCIDGAWDEGHGEGYDKCEKERED